jgi:nucleotide-binding universal stress UspA family protein
MVCVVGVDGSDGSRVALRWGCDFAAAMADRLCVVRAWEYPSMSMLPGRAALRGPDEVDVVVAAEVDKFVREVLGADGEHAEVVAERGPADYALLHAARHMRPAALVVGKRGLGAVTARLLGSVSRRLAEHAPCPVIIVPPESAGAGGPIVVGVDGSANAAAAMRWAVTVAQATGASITAVHGFNPPPTELAGPVIEQLQLDGQAVVDGQCHTAAAAGIECRTVVDMRDPRVLIEHVAGESDASMIVAGARGTGTLEVLLLGSVAGYLAQHSDRPVAIVPAADRDRVDPSPEGER